MAYVTLHRGGCQGASQTVSPVCQRVSHRGRRRQQSLQDVIKTFSALAPSTITHVSRHLQPLLHMLVETLSPSLHASDCHLYCSWLSSLVNSFNGKLAMWQKMRIRIVSWMAHTWSLKLPLFLEIPAASQTFLSTPGTCSFKYQGVTDPYK